MTEKVLTWTLNHHQTNILTCWPSKFMLSDTVSALDGMSVVPISSDHSFDFWVRPDMTEKLLTGTLNINTNKLISGYLIHYVFHSI